MVIMAIPASSHWCERLYEEKAAQLILYGRALGLSHNEAEDVVQETFLGLLQLSEFPKNPAHYCVRAYRNRAFNYRRSLWRRLWREFEAQRWFDSAGEDDPREILAREGLERLPTDQREVIVLKIWHEFTFADIGNLLEISPHTAAGRYRYGIQKLQTLLKDNPHECIRSIGNAIRTLETPTAIPEA
jgi:RNA polymerase sigma-70 factor, ECF subfamily